MIVKKRFLFWLLKAYLKKWGKIVVLFFFVGLAVFFVLLYAFQYITTKVLLTSKKTIGIVGAYTVDTIPDTILQNVSRGLTKVDKNGQPQADLASFWQVKDDGRTYVLKLRPDTFFNDGSKLTSQDISYAFTDVKITKPDLSTIVFHLKDPYAPFLIALSHPIFKNGFVGVGTFRVKDIKLNGNFVQSLTLSRLKDSGVTRTYQFYPTEDALKVAFMIGEVSTISNIHDLQFKNTSFEKFKNVSVIQQTDYTHLVTLFYNTSDKTLSDKRLRDALAYALPNSFVEGERSHSPIAPTSWAYQADTVHVQDFVHAKLLLQAAQFDVKTTQKEQFVITAIPKYKHIAELVKASWNEIGINSKIALTDTIPSSFQIFLGEFNVPKDPDQYTLWHSYQTNNISNYNKNLRIDKLLEDGRKTLNQDQRIKIYQDFQKYLLDDQPASFLYFPYSYTITRK